MSNRYKKELDYYRAGGILNFVLNEIISNAALNKMNDKNENLLAILGPTNTGKTYSAFEKLFSYSSGMIGFPLRLLARENYDKAIKKVGVNKCFNYR